MTQDKLRYGITKSRAGHSHVWVTWRTALGSTTWRSGRLDHIGIAQALCRAIREADIQAIKHIDIERDTRPLLEKLTELEPVTQARCYNCALTLAPAACGAAEVDAVWVDSDGATDGVRRTICRECLAAGVPSGPGYVTSAQAQLSEATSAPSPALRADKINFEFTKAELNQVSIALAGREMKLADAISFVEHHLGDAPDSNARFLTDARAQQDAVVKLHVKIIKLLTGGE